jgi:flagellar export protein FliJ
VHARLAKARAALGQAAAARRSMELLRDRRREEFESIQAKAEAVQADDIVSSPAFRSAEEAA